MDHIWSTYWHLSGHVRYLVIAKQLGLIIGTLGHHIIFLGHSFVHVYKRVESKIAPSAFSRCIKDEHIQRSLN